MVFVILKLDYVHATKVILVTIVQPDLYNVLMIVVIMEFVILKQVFVHVMKIILD
jgi:hypothetical protein